LEPNCKSYGRKGKTEKEKEEIKKKEEKGSHWADPGTGPAQQPPNQPTRGSSLPFLLPFLFIFADGWDPPVRSFFPEPLPGHRNRPALRFRPLLKSIDYAIKSFLPCLYK
jgi:hypothetical protein